MSLIVPRPLLEEYLPQNNDFKQRHHEIKPCITGWEQVDGRNAISLEEKFELDVWHVENISLVWAFIIILIRFSNVIQLRNINQSSEITMKFFHQKNKSLC